MNNMEHMDQQEHECQCHDVLDNIWDFFVYSYSILAIKHLHDLILATYVRQIF